MAIVPNKDECEYWHPTKEQKSFNKKEVEAAQRFAVRSRSASRARKAAFKGGKGHKDKAK